MSGTHPDLATLLRGELGNAAAIEAADHARSCAACQEDLVDLSLGHGLLTAAGRTTSSAPGQAPAQDREGLPPGLRREVRRARWRPVAVAAAVVLALVGVAGALVGQERPGQQDARPAVTAQTTTSLQPVPAATGSETAARGGQVSMTTGRQLTRMRVHTVELPRAARGEFYYVWLLDPRTNKMLPLGQVMPGRPATFDVPESLVEAYSAIDISLEADDGDPGHSVTSVLRASYGASS